jgi:hypothetical protein
MCEHCRRRIRGRVGGGRQREGMENVAIGQERSPKDVRELGSVL